MRRRYSMVLSVLMGLSNLIGAATVHAEQDAEPHKVHHVVVVWLKQAGDENVRRQYIEESKPLSRLPGVLSYDIGVPVAIRRGHVSTALDESYDLAISSSYQSQQDFEDFLKNPEYLRVAQQVLRPLVDRYKVYDFIE